MTNFLLKIQNFCLRERLKLQHFFHAFFKVFQEFSQFLKNLNLILFVNTCGKLQILFLLVTIKFCFSWKASLKIFENCLKTSSEEFLFSKFPGLRPKSLLHVTLTQGFFASLRNINYKSTVILNRIKFHSTNINICWFTHSFTAFTNNICIDWLNNFL